MREEGKTEVRTKEDSNLSHPLGKGRVLPRRNNTKKVGVTLPIGLQYKIIKERRSKRNLP